MARRSARAGRPWRALRRATEAGRSDRLRGRASELPRHLAGRRSAVGARGAEAGPGYGTREGWKDRRRLVKLARLGRCFSGEGMRVMRRAVAVLSGPCLSWTSAGAEPRQATGPWHVDYDTAQCVA